jgi:hypothetical protein
MLERRRGRASGSPRATKPSTWTRLSTAVVSPKQDLGQDGIYEPVTLECFEAPGKYDVSRNNTLQRWNACSAVFEGTFLKVGAQNTTVINCEIGLPLLHLREWGARLRRRSDPARPGSPVELSAAAGRFAWIFRALRGDLFACCQERAAPPEAEHSARPIASARALERSLNQACVLRRLHELIHIASRVGSDFRHGKARTFNLPGCSPP